MKVLDFKRWFGLFVKKTSNHFQQLATHSFYLLFLLVVFIIILLSSCTSNQSTSNVPKFSIVYPEKTFANTNVTISVQPLEPGLTNIRIKLKNADSQVYEEEIRVYKYPYEIPWVFKKPGIYSLVVEGYSISENRWYTANGTITVYDVIPPIIEEVRILPERPYVGDEVMLQMKVKSQNPIVNYYIDGKTSDSLWINQTLVEKAGYVYKKLSPINSAGKVELFLKTAAYNMEDATKVTFEVNQVDRVKPVINVFTKTFYPENSDISFEVKFFDDQELSSYQIEFDGEVIEEGSIRGKTFEKAVRIGKRELGTHTLNINVRDKEGNPAYYSKRIYVGSAALSFDVEVSPANLTAGGTAVIALVSQETNVKYTKIVFFVDGKAIDTSIASEGKEAKRFTLWDVEEGSHIITIYAESDDNRGGIAETIASVPDYNGPKFISLTANDVELKKDKPGYVFPGLVTFKIKVYDPGGVNTGVKPRLLIRENNFDYYYKDLLMEAEEISSDGKTVVFSVTTTMGLGYYYITVLNVQDLSGNVMRDIGTFLLYAQ
ncbi:MAG: hypothetical protein HPY87_06830 [Fervidobacterium sp.]|uniref:hypothetical protein n=1 Tax=Fervidobacterium sp. TaxID=1871331 RepID=UPI0025C102EE|nr:hypothetical protein [Fervidobacterium sp.]NPU89590.1 hypothetical protein [Fervidobacterium sp.]